MRPMGVLYYESVCVNAPHLLIAVVQGPSHSPLKIFFPERSHATLTAKMRKSDLLFLLII